MCLLAVALLLADYYTTWLTPVRSWLLGVSRPIYVVVDAPRQAWQWTQGYFVSRDQLRFDNARLQTENLILQAKVQKLSALTIENIRLRELLNSTRTLEQNFVIAEIISVSPDPFSHFVILSKGSKHGAYIGQAVVDADGLFGQVVEVSERTSKVLLITDARHGVPVQIDRNGVRLIVEGAGDYTRLQLPFVTATTDLMIGDVLSTSGLGGVFPSNYPVARVVDIKHDPGQPFSEVLAEPFAQLSRARHVLLLFSQSADHEE